MSRTDFSTVALVALVREAGEILRAHYRRAAEPGALEIFEKADHSPVTAADLAVDAFLRPRLAELTGRPVISEEHDVPYAERRDWEEFWLLDPLDGTKDFIARNDEFCIALALVVKGEPRLGVIYGPVVDEFYFGDRREGHAPEAWCEQAGTRRAMPFVRPSPALCARSRHHHSKSAAAFAAQHGLELTPCGSALKFGRVAAGQYRAYGSFGNPAEWDAAPGFAIVEAAGGRAESLAEKFAWNTEALRAFPFSIWSGS